MPEGDKLMSFDMNSIMRQAQKMQEKMAKMELTAKTAKMGLMVKTVKMVYLILKRMNIF